MFIKRQWLYSRLLRASIAFLHGIFSHSKQPYATVSNPTPGLHNRKQPYARPTQPYVTLRQLPTPKVRGAYAQGT